jgi:hypothetical protein
MVPSWTIPIPQAMQRHLGSQAPNTEPSRPPGAVLDPPPTADPDAGSHSEADGRTGSLSLGSVMSNGRSPVLKRG